MPKQYYVQNPFFLIITGVLCRIYRFLQKQCLSIITYGPLEMCGAYIYRGPVPAFSYFLLELLSSGHFWAATFGQWVCSPN